MAKNLCSSLQTDIQLTMQYYRKFNLKEEHPWIIEVLKMLRSEKSHPEPKQGSSIRRTWRKLAERSLKRMGGEKKYNTSPYLRMSVLSGRIDAKQ